MKLAANRSAAVRVSFTNANGLPAKVQGDVSWESSDPAIATVQVKPDDTEEATVTAGPSAGTATIFATADADMGEGVREAEATIDVTVVARGEAVGGEITPVGPNNSLPGEPGRPDNSLPGSGGRPDQGLPGGGGRPDNSLPGSGGPVDPGFGQGGGPVDPGFGQGGGKPDNSLPGSGAKPGNELPDTPQPKSKR